MPLPRYEIQPVENGYIVTRYPGFPGDVVYYEPPPPPMTWVFPHWSDLEKRVHEWVRDAFARLGVASELAPCCRKTTPGQCFVGYEKSDVLWQGRKIAGAAQRRTRTGLLIQGSVQPPPLDLAKADWQAAMCVAAIGRWCAGWDELVVEGELLARAEWLEETKYAQTAYNEKR